MSERPAAGLDIPLSVLDGLKRGDDAAVAQWLRQQVATPTAPVQRTEETENTEESHRTLFDAVPISLCVLGVDGRIRDLNQQAVALLGENALGNLLVRYADATDEGQLQRLIRRARGGDIAHGRCVIQGCDGDRSILALKVAPVWHGDAIAQLVVAARDVSAEAELLAARAEVQAVKAAHDAKSRFLSRVSHELRTPLNSLLGFAELIRGDLGSHDLRTLQRLDQIELAGRRLQELLEQTLDLSRLEIGAVNLRIHAVAVAPLVAGSIEKMHGEALANSVRLVSTGPAKDIHALADAMRLAQVLETLLAIAIRRSPLGGSVQVAVESQGTGVRVTVADAGMAPNTESLQAMFSPLEQTLAQTVPGESNMRLTIARQLCSLMGGSLTAEAGVNGGVEFRCWVPCATQQAGSGGSRPTALPSRPCRVLYVEDVESNVELLRQVLAGTHWELLVATTGLEGVEQAKLHQPDLLLLDLNLPDIDGVEVRRRLLQDPVTAPIPCAALTADVVGRQQSPPDVPFDAWLVKPLRLKLLRETMARLVISPPDQCTAGCPVAP